MRAWRAVALAVLAILAGCAEDELRRPQQTRRDIPSDVEEFLRSQTEASALGDEGLLDVSGVDEVLVATQSLAFRPTVLAGDPGQELIIRLRNEGEGPHTFTVDDQGVNVRLRIGQTGTATVTVPESEEPVLVHCRFHRDQGMVGALVSAEAP